MPLVYVHGVGNRPGRRFAAHAALRDSLFRRFLIPTVFPRPDQAHIFTPNWGAHVPSPAWELASLPTVGEELGGAEDPPEVVLSGDGADPATRLLATARQSFADAVDALYVLADIGESDAAAFTDLAERLVAYRTGQEQLHPHKPEEERYPWLDEVTDDLMLLDRLLTGVAGDTPGKADVGKSAGAGRLETLGEFGQVRDLLATGVQRIRQVVSPVTTGPAGLVRSLLSAALTGFAGDIVAYFANRGDVDSPGLIIRTVAAAMDEAEQVGRDGEPLLVVAHSMGGNIVYDLLTYYRPDLQVDLLVTIGSQVGLFEELKLFRASQAHLPGAEGKEVPLPPNVRRWINVVDRSDVLGYRAGPIFAGAVDYVYPTNCLWAHTAYLRQPNFHARLARRLAERP